MKFDSKGPINSIPALVPIMTWRRPGDKPLFEPMMIYFADAYMRQSASKSQAIRPIWMDYSTLDNTL